MATNPNPYRNPGPWGLLTIGTIAIPGIIVSIGGAEKPVEWLVQRPVMGANAVTIWKGDKLAEDITITVNLPSEVHVDLWYGIRDVLHPKLGKKPPALIVVNPVLNFARITRACYKSMSGPAQTTGNSWLGKIVLIEYGPPVPIQVGPPDPPHAETEADRLAKEAQGLFNEAKNL